MDPREALRLTRALLDAHGLSHINVETMRKTSRLAECRFRRPFPWEDPKAHTIALSTGVVKANEWEALAPVVLHEIAHAIAGYAAGHGPAFVSVAIALGGVPTPSHSMPNPAAGGWHAQCPACRKRMRRARLSHKRFHCWCTHNLPDYTRPFLTWKHADGREGTCLTDVRHAIKVEA